MQQRHHFGQIETIKRRLAELSILEQRLAEHSKSLKAQAAWLHLTRLSSRASSRAERNYLPSDRASSDGNFEIAATAGR